LGGATGEATNLSGEIDDLGGCCGGNFGDCITDLTGCVGCGLLAESTCFDCCNCFAPFDCLASFDCLANSFNMIDGFTFEVCVTADDVVFFTFGKFFFGNTAGREGKRSLVWLLPMLLMCNPMIRLYLLFPHITLGIIFFFMKIKLVAQKFPPLP
jgi:hypothetical protein